MNRKTWAGLAALVGVALITHIGTRFTMDSVGSSAEAEGEPEPLYWVAPMDPNYRRDEPGKSPMGMDLVPVYEESKGTMADNPGAVSISPAVVNSLGVRTAMAGHRSLQASVDTVGYVGYSEDHLTHIHPRVAGWIETLHVKAVGDALVQGQPLYSLYSPALVNAQEELILALERNNTDLIRASEDRLRALQVDDRIIAGIRKDRTVRHNVTFYTPRAGFVDRLPIREGFYVEPGTTLMSVGSLEVVWVEADVFESQMAQIGKGQSVTMTSDAFPGRTWLGQIDHVYPTLDPATRTLRVRILFANADGALRPGMFARVGIQVDPGAPVLSVPRDAVIRTGTQARVVLALEDGRFKSVEVEPGRVAGGFTEIRSGLHHGDRVVVSAQFLLDSESSRSSDFQRLDSGAMDHTGTAGDSLDHATMDHTVTADDSLDHATMDHDSVDHDTVPDEPDAGVKGEHAAHGDPAAEVSHD